MKLFWIFSIFFFTIVKCIENTFKIDFSFLIPEDNNTIQIGINSNDESESNLTNKNTFLQNMTYYQNIKPITNICLGDPFQCFQIIISFNICETILNLNITNFDYKKSSSFSLLSDLDTVFYASDTVKLGKRSKNVISKYNFILINETNSSEPDLSNLNVIGLGKNRLFGNYSTEKDYSFSLVKQLLNKNIITTTEMTIKYENDFSGKITLGTDYFQKQIDESLYLELPNNENSFNGYLQSIYVVDTTIRSTKRQRLDLLEKGMRQRITLDFNSAFIVFGEEIFEKLKITSFNSYINAGICDIKKDDNFQIQYIICKDDILNSNLDKLIFLINQRKNIAINLNDLFLPYQEEKEKKNLIFGIISGDLNNTIYIGTILLKKYRSCINREKNSVRLYLKNISKEIPTDYFGIGGIIVLAAIICLLIIYMVTTICGKDKLEPNYSPKAQKFLSKKNLDSSMQSNESF